MANLYEFTVGSSTPYRYTSGSKDISISGIVYEAIAIERSEIFLDFSQDALTIKMQEDKEPASSLKKLDVTDRIRIIVKDLDSSNTILYEGYVESSQYHLKKGLIVLKCSRFPHAKGAAISRQISPTCSFSWGQAFAQAGLTSGGTANLTAGSSVATGTFSTVSLNDMLWIDGAVYRVFELTSSSSIKIRRVPTEQGTAQYARATASGVSWYNITSLNGCPVNKEDFKFNQTGMATNNDWTFTVANGVSKVLTYSGSGSPSLFDTTDGVFDYKYGRAILKKADGTIISQNYIRDVSSTTISFMKPIPDSDASVIDEIIAYQGCNKKFKTCRDKFNASPFYGGMPYLTRLTSATIPDEYNPLKTGARSVPEVMGKAWVTPRIFYVGPELQAANWKSKKHKGPLFGLFAGHTEEWLEDYDIYKSMGFALATKVDFLLTIKRGDDFLKSCRSPLPINDSSGNQLTYLQRGSGDTFPLNRNGSFYTEIDYLLKEGEGSQDLRDINYAFPKITSINEDKENYSKVVWNPNIAESWQLDEDTFYRGIDRTWQKDRNTLTYNEFYSGEDHIATEIIEMVEAWEPYKYPEIRYVGMSYFIMGLTVNLFKPYYKTLSIAEASAQNAIQLGAFQGTYKEYDAKELKENFLNLKALVFHAPKIAGTRTLKDFISKRRSEITLHETCSYTAGSNTITFTGTEFDYVRTRWGSSSVIDYNSTNTFWPTLAQDNVYVQLSDSYSTAQGFRDIWTDPRLVTSLGWFYDNSAYGGNPTNADKDYFTVESAWSWNEANAKYYGERRGYGLAYNLRTHARTTPAFGYRQDVNVGDMIELDSNIYFISEIVDYNTIKVSEPLLTSGSGKTAYVADAFGANPVNVIYYMMTEMLGIPQSDMDITSFEEARDQVYSEKLSVNFELDSADQTKSKIDSILDLIGGVIYWNPSNSNYRIGLKRDTEYGTLGFNGIKKTYDTTNSKDFLVDYPTMDSLYTEVSLTFKKQNIAVQRGEIEEESDLVLNKTNEINADALGQVKVKKLSNEFISNEDAASFYLALKSSEFLFSPIKVSFKVAVTDLDTIHIGCLVAYSDPSYDINFNAIRITKISAFNEFSAEVSVEGITEYDIDVDNSGDWEEGSTYGPEAFAEISNIEFIPEFYDSIGYFNNPAYINSDVGYVLPQYNTRSPSINKTEVEFFKYDSNNLVKNSAGKIDGVISATLKGGRNYLGTVDTSGYSPTGFIDPNGFVVTLRETDITIPSVASDGYPYIAIISRRIISNDDLVLENSDYEMIAFKEISVSTQPTKTTTGEAIISGVVRNIMGNNYYQENPYTQGDQTNYESGKTNFTGQFKHSAGVDVYIFTAKWQAPNQRLEFLKQWDNKIDQYIISGIASLKAKTIRRKNDVPIEYDYRAGSYSGTDAEMEGDNKAPFKMKNRYALPPAKLMGYTFHDSSHEYFYILYWSPANIQSGASWRPPEQTSCFTYPDTHTLIEFNDPDWGGTKRVIIKPDESFQDASINKLVASGLQGELNELVNGQYIKGILFNKEWSTAGGNIKVDAGTSLGTVNIITATDVGNSTFYIQDDLKKMDISNHGLFVYATNRASLTFDVSHIRPNINNNNPSIKRRITLTASGSTHTFTDLVIE